MANNTLLASDNFASGSLAAGWSALHGLLTVKVVGSGASAVTEPNSVSVTAGQLWTGLSWPNDHVSEVTLGSGWTNTNVNTVSLQVRFSTSAISGYQVNITGGATNTATATIFVLTNGVATQLVQTTALTTAPGDVWSFQVLGPCLVVCQNYKVVAFWCDTTYASGSPGYSQFAGSNITQDQISSWRGYNSVQQDGIWQKQGGVNIPLVASDINTGASQVNSGTDSGSIILHEGNAQILSGTVYKMWFGTASGIQYAESIDLVTWSRWPSTLIAGFTFPQIIKVGNTYNLYVQSNTIAPGTGNINLYQSTDGINWSNISSTVLALGGVGTWDHTSIYLFSPVGIINGTWYALYSGTGTNAQAAFAMGLATSPDGVTWTKYVSNPVAEAVWGGVPYLINGTYYLWSAGVVPGQEAAGQNPTIGLRIQSTDLINWTNRIPSIQHSQIVEGVNKVAGFAYPNAVIDVGGKANMIYEAGPSNTVSSTGASWNLALAIAPAPMASIILFNENAIQVKASDSFTSGNGSLSANWTTPTGGTALQIVSGPEVEGTVIGTRAQAVYTGASFSNDQYSQATLHALSGSNLEVQVRASTSSLTYYMGVLASTTNTLNATGGSIWKVVNGVFTQIGPGVPATPQVGDVVRLQVVGNVLSLYQNDYLLVQVEDVNNTITSGNPGLQLLPAAALTNAQVSSWAGGNANKIPAYPSGASSSWLTIAQINSLRGLRH